MKYAEIIMRGLMYVSSCFFCTALIISAKRLIRVVQRCECDHCCNDCIEKCSKTESERKSNAKMRGKSYLGKYSKGNKSDEIAEESEEARKLRIELENIDAFYTDRAQKEVE